MKYSALTPIRSKNEVYTPFSGLRARKMIHSRAQSEVPTPLHTSAMGIQCDSTEFLNGLLEESHIIAPSVVLTGNRKKISIVKQPSMIQTIESRSQIESDSIKARSSTPGCENQSTDSVNLLNRITFSKIGDWNETYVLRNRNSSNNSTYKQLSRVVPRKTCKIVEFSANIISQVKPQGSHPWEYKSSDAGIFNVSGMLKLRKRYKTNYKY